MTSPLDILIQEEGSPEDSPASSPEILQAFMDDENSIPGDDLTDSLTEDAERFTVKDAYESAGVLAAHVNRGLLGIADLPFMLGNHAINLVNHVTGSNISRATLPISEGMSEITDPSLQGSKKNVERMRPLGIALEYTSGAFLPVAGINRVGQASRSAMQSAPSKGLQAPLPAGAKSTTPTVSETLSRPSAIRAEAGLSVASGAGAGVASYASNGDPVAELLGGIMTPASIGLISHGLDSGTALYQFGKQRFSKDERVSNAVDIVLRHADDPATALTNIRKNIALNRSGSVGQLAEDDGLLGFEKLMSKRSKGNFNARLDANDQALADELYGVIDNLKPEDVENAAQVYLRARIEASKSAVQSRLVEAKKNARSALERKGTSLETEDASKILNDEIDATLKIAEARHKELWADVPNTKVKTDGIFEEVDTLFKKAFESSTAKDLAQAPFTDSLKKLKKWEKAGEVDVVELIDLRSAILEKIRMLKRSSNPDKSLDRFSKKLAADIQDVLLDRIVKSDGGEQYRKAAEYTKFMSDTFRGTSFDSKDDISQVLGSRVFRSGERGAQTADEMLKLQGVNDGIGAAVENQVRADYVRSVASDGVVDLNKATTFLKKHSDFLRRFPKVRADIEETIDAQQLTEKFAGHQARSNSHLDKSIVNTFIEFEDPVRAVNSLVSGSQKTPVKAAETLLRMASKDKTGSAVQGLQRMTVDALLSRVTRDLNGSTGFSANFANEYKKLQPVLRTVFKDNKEALATLDDAMLQVGTLLSRKGAKIPHDTIEKSLLLITAGKIAGARVGAKIGTTPLISASLGGRLMEKALDTLPRDLTADLMEEMLLNPQKFAESAKNIQKITTQPQAVRLLNAWLLNAGVRSQIVSSEEEEETFSVN